jgi:hypothetical protein
MLVVLAHSQDTEAAEFARGCGRLHARLLRASDLSLAGWRHHVGEPGDEWAMIDGERVACSEITGVITRFPAVQSGELLQIEESDRAYVASEMTAFLASWLVRLRCPVLNRPSPSSLMGPNFSVERWRVLARRAGLSALARTPEPLPPTVAVTVVGEHWFGDVAPALGEHALRLARFLRLELLNVSFAGREAGAPFVNAEPFTPLNSEPIAAALLSRLCGGRA